MPVLSVIAEITIKNEAKLALISVKSPLNDVLKPEEVIIRIEAAPINPSDMALLCPPGTDEEALKQIRGENDTLTYPINKKFAKLLAPRIGKPSPAGNEGAGVVVKTGSSPNAKALLNKVVSVAGGKMYSQYRKVNIKSVIPHLDGTTAEEAASSYVNPVTAVCIVDNVKRDGHKAFIHTAAASQLGIMMNKLCNQEGLPIVNIVRKPAQEKLLKEVGAKYIVRSDKPSFMADLIKAVHDTKATCAFDAIGGGNMTNTLLMAMELAAKKDVKVDPASFYGTDVFKQVYIYGGLDRSATTLQRGFGMSWGVSGWLMPNYLASIGPEKSKDVFMQVAKNIKTTFKTNYFKKISLKELVTKEAYLDFIKQQTGKKYLVCPQKDIAVSKL